MSKQSNDTPSNPAPTTLSGLIAAANFRLRWFDLGRRVREIHTETAEQFEAGETPWPHPYLRHAWCGLLLWPKADTDGAPVAWFLRLPLDEQGKLLLPVRDRFLRQLDDALKPIAGATDQQNSDPAARLQRALDDSGLTYTPPDERRAVFHAKAAQRLKHPPSSHWPAAQKFAEQPDHTAWQHLALQGIADLAVRWQEVKPTLVKHTGEYPAPFLISLCQCLEGEPVDGTLTRALIRRADTVLTNIDAAPGDRESLAPADLALLTAIVRGISHSTEAHLRQDFLLKLLESPAAANGEVLAAIGSRCCDDLLIPELAELWLQNLSESQPQQTFNLLLTDLLFLPQLRNVLLETLRNPERSEAIARAFGEFLQPSGQ
ncbi:DUF3549 family protein [Microbulbifer celer]|uniref:DUF3549 family protein n=1 Tax=Microbulbifer celer TaxID=435905 RepID=A0ABW3UDL0_9GAMM|nr:DUF3549 family protein [Microbulbifer celer]UFN55922.1 DUF3549 family protein [Microbulbifer celer]